MTVEPQAVSAVLPYNLVADALDVSVLQDAMLRVEQLHNEARYALFRKLAVHILQGPADVFDAAMGELGDRVADLAQDSNEANLAHHAALYRNLCHQEQQLISQQAVDAVEQDVRAQLNEFHTLLTQGQLSDAAWCLVRLRKLVQEEQETASRGASHDGGVASGGGAIVVEAAQRHLELCAAAEQTLALALDAGTALSVQVPGGDVLPPGGGSALMRGAVLLELMGTRVTVASKEVWAAVAAAGQLEARVRKLSDLLFEHVMRPLLSGTVTWTHVQHPGATEGVPDDTLLTWDPAHGAPPPRPCEACRQVLQALAATVFQLDESLVRSLGDSLWQPLSDLYVTAYVTPAAAQAAGAGDSGALEGLVQAAGDLEEWAANVGFVDGAYLQPAVSAAVHRFEARQQVAPMAAAQQALLLDLAGTGDSELVGSPLSIDGSLYKQLMSGRCPDWLASDPGCGMASDSSLVAAGQCRVGVGAAQVARLVGQVLEQAEVAGSQAASAALVHCLPKIASLALGLPLALPSARQQLSTVLPLALRHINGLNHVADALLLGQTAHGPRLEPILGSPLGLLEPALMLRHEAERRLTEQVQAQVQALLELTVSGFKGFRRLGRSGSAQEGIAYRKTMAQLLHTMGRMGKVMADHLRPATMVQVAQQVLAGVCASVVADIMTKRDIGIDDCKELREVLGPLAQQGVEALVQAPPAPQGATGSTRISGVPVPVVREVVVSTCTPLRKLRMLLELLDTNLKEVVAAWEKRKLQGVGFSADEVVHLLGALFEASELRKDAIARIKASAW